MLYGLITLWLAMQNFMVKSGDSMAHRWTPEEVETLLTFYGRTSVKRLCLRLNVTYDQLRHKAKALGLGYQREYSEYVTMRQVREMMNVIIGFDDLLKWLENNQGLWDSTKIEFRAFGGEAEWLREKRKKIVSIMAINLLVGKDIGGVVMNKEDLIVKLKSLQDLSKHDEEKAHAKADELITTFLVRLGYEDVVTEYNKVSKWYA